MDRAVRQHLESRQQQPLVHLCLRSVEVSRGGKPDRRRDVGDQPQQRPSVLLLILSFGASVEQPLPFRVLLLRWVDLPVGALLLAPRRDRGQVIGAVPGDHRARCVQGSELGGGQGDRQRAKVLLDA
jgi:hypothetical protein